MEQIAKETEEASSYTMNTDVVSDTEEWHKRKGSSTKKNQDQTSMFHEGVYCTDRKLLCFGKIIELFPRYSLLFNQTV